MIVVEEGKINEDDEEATRVSVNVVSCVLTPSLNCFLFFRMYSFRDGFTEIYYD